MYMNVGITQFANISILANTYYVNYSSVHWNKIDSITTWDQVIAWLELKLQNFVDAAISAMPNMAMMQAHMF